MNILQKAGIRGALLLLCSCLFPLACQAVGDDAKLRAAVDAAVKPLMAEYDVPGMAVAVTVNGKRAFFNYGLASKEAGMPVSEHTLFEVGSISKTFNVTLALYARALGKLSLDDHPSKYMPQLKGSAIDAASLVHLGTYTAGGLPLQFPDEVMNDAQMIDYFKTWKPDVAPGAVRRYSNPSIGLFGHLTALALKSDFTEAMESTVLPKLGLRETYLRVPQSAMTGYAWGYAKANKPIRVNPGVFAAEAYGVKISAADMIRYLQANIDPAKLDPMMRNAIEGTHIGYFDAGDMVQGLGWEQYPYPVTLERLQAGNGAKMIMEPNAVKPLSPPRAPVGPALFNKTGSTNGFGAYVLFVPEAKIGIALLANKSYPIPARVKAAHAILEQLAQPVK